MNVESGLLIFLVILISDLQAESAAESVDLETFSDCGLDKSVGGDSRIGGKEAKRGEFPWHLGVYDYSSRFDTPLQICGATILTRKVAISAARCFWNAQTNELFPVGSYGVAAGKLYEDYENEEDKTYPYVQFSDLDNIIVSREYYGSEQFQQSDIALLVLTKLLDFSDHVNAICLDLFDSTFDKKQTDVGVIGKVTGWGVIAEEDSSFVLKKVEIPVVNFTECRKKIPLRWRRHLSDDKFCAGYLNDTRLCKGDAGGGLVFKSSENGQDRWYLRGIVSVTIPSENSNTCGADTYTGFTKIFEHNKWIADNLKLYI